MKCSRITGIITPEKPKYPYLGESKSSSNLIVLFDIYNSGLVINQGESKVWRVGEYCGSFNEDNFIPLSPSQQVILSND